MHNIDSSLGTNVMQSHFTSISNECFIQIIRELGHKCILHTPHQGTLHIAHTQRGQMRERDALYICNVHVQSVAGKFIMCGGLPAITEHRTAQHSIFKENEPKLPIETASLCCSHINLQQKIIYNIQLIWAALCFRQQNV